MGASVGRSAAARVRARPAPRVAEKAVEARPADRRTFLLRLARGGLVLALAVFLFQLLNAPVFRVQRVEVAGNAVLTREDILQAAGVLDRNIFTLDRREVAQSIGALGVLRGVEVGLSLPGSVQVRVVEYEPRYVWQSGAGAYLVDERGVVLGTARAGVNLPTVRETGGQGRNRGERLDLGALEAAAAVVKVWPARLGKVPICEFSQEGLALVGEKWRAVLGPSADAQAKVLSLAAVLDHAEQTGAELSLVDLRVFERPYYR